jgi:hypothetical protein
VHSGSYPVTSGLTAASTPEEVAKHQLETYNSQGNGKFTGTGSRVSGVFDRLRVTGVGSQVEAIVLNGFMADGTGVKGTVYVPIGQQVTFNVTGVGADVRQVRKSYVELLKLANKM